MTSSYSQNAPQLIKLTKIFNKSSLSNLLRLSDHTVTLAYQLKEYKLMNLNFISFISDDVVILIHKITTLYKQSSIQETQTAFSASSDIFSFA